MVISISTWFFAYVLGSIPFGVLLARAQNIDLHEHGSKNIGATNATRILGKKAGALTLLGDTLKGWLGVVAASWVSSDSFTIAGAGIMVFLGHLFSVFLKFKGGKGVATMLGVILFISSFGNTIIFSVTVFSWLMIVFFTRYVALGSVISLTIATIYSFFYIPDLFIFFVLMTLLITYKHKDNFERIKNKTEHKISF